jgi:hypothetical protein
VISPYSVAVGDFNGDGIPDLAVADWYSGTVSVLLGKGDGAFQAAPSFAAGSGPSSVAVGDFNGDGILDLAVASYYSGVSVLLGQGDGTFLPAVNYPAGIYPHAVAVGDFNGDGIPDLAVANSGSNNVSVLLGKGDGTFLPAVNYPAGIHPYSVAVGDFNGDGKPDLAVANNDYPYPGTVSVLLGQGDGTFLPAQAFPAGSWPASVAVGDFNGDGILDLAVANSIQFNGTVSVLLGQGDGTFLPAQAFPAGFQPSAVAVGDFNGDGKLDLVLNNGKLLLGNADGTFQAPISYGPGGFAVAVGDFNGDAKPDLAVVAGTVRVLLGKGGGAFQTSNVSYVAGSYPTAVAVGDFNGDGFPDLAVANVGSNNVSILLNDANWPAGPGRARAGPSHLLIPQPLPPPAVLHVTAGEEPRLAGSPLLTVAPPPGNGLILAPPAPLALPGADPPRPTILPIMLAQGRPSALADPRAGPRARGAPWGALDHLFAELATNGLWDDRTDDGMPLLA